ncbi:hypothetical protein, partial [Mesorhizobium sp.]|uniref:hypothetical protein n=1 Tax=Mesorhizobium sp. TaxID=1871066 RepID=UPI0025C2F0CE
AVDEAVDEVIFERRAVAPDEVEDAVVLAHGSKPFPQFLWLASAFRLTTFRGVLRSRPSSRIQSNEL